MFRFSVQHAPKAFRACGFSLIELLLVLGVLAILLVAMFVVYPQVRTSQQASREAGNVILLQAGIRTAFASRGVYSALGAMNSGRGETFVNQSRIAPATLNDGNPSSNQLQSSWGPVLIHSNIGAYAGYGAGRMFVIRYMDVPKAACVDFVSKTISKFDVVRLNTASNSGYMTPESFTVADVVTACNAGDTTEVVFLGH